MYINKPLGDDPLGTSNWPIVHESICELIVINKRYHRDEYDMIIYDVCNKEIIRVKFNKDNYMMQRIRL